MGALALLMFAAGSGLTVWFCVDALVGGLYRGLRQFAYGGRYSYAMMIILLVVLVFVSLLLLGAAAPAGVKSHRPGLAPGASKVVAHPQIEHVGVEAGSYWNDFSEVARTSGLVLIASGKAALIRGARDNAAPESKNWG